MKSVRLGKTELLVSDVGFGGIPIIPLGFEEGVSVVQHCFDQGITFFDTANAYGDSERKIGQALENVRDKVVVATKTMRRDSEGVSKHIQYSLDNLKTDRIDLYQFHNVRNEEELDKILAPGGGLETANTAIEEGRIGFVGFSSHDLATAIKCCRTGIFSTVQIPFNFIEKDPVEELFTVAHEMDMGMIAMKPIGGGLLDRVDLCFKFLQQYPYVVPIPGVKSREEVDEIIAFYDSPRPLSDEDYRDIEKMRSELGRAFCHRCGYCMPCEQGVKIPDVMGFRSFAKRLAPKGAIAMSKAAMETGDNCNECGECLDRCPYSLPIPELIKEHLEMFNNFVKEHG